MRATNDASGEPGGKLLAILPSGAAVEVLPLATAAATVATALGRLLPDALQWLASRIEAGALASYLVTDPNRYALPADEGTVWRVAQRARTPAPAPPHRGGFVRRPFEDASMDAMASRLASVVGPGVNVRVGVPPAPPSPPAVVRPPMVGNAGLAELLREAAAAACDVSRLAWLRLALRADELQAMLAALRPSSALESQANPLRIKRRERMAWAQGARGDGLALVHLADLAQALAARVPAKVARDNVRARLSTDAAPLFLAPPALDDFAPMVGESSVWHAALPAGLATWHKAQAAARPGDLVVLGPSWLGAMHGAEALLRGLALDREEPACGAPMEAETWKALPVVPERVGRSGALELFTLCAVPGAEVASPELASHARALAITEADAARLFPELAAPRSFWDDSPAESARAAAAPVAIVTPMTTARGAAALSAAGGVVRVDPAGGAWPRDPGKPWTDAEREAMFEMRHRHKVSGPKLAGIVGVSRQAIDEAIGPARITATTKWPDAWRPSVELMQRCGLALQPLQAMALAAG